MQKLHESQNKHDSKTSAIVINEEGLKNYKKVLLKKKYLTSNLNGKNIQIPMPAWQKIFRMSEDDEIEAICFQFQSISIQAQASNQKPTVSKQKPADMRENFLSDSSAQFIPRESKGNQFHKEDGKKNSKFYNEEIKDTHALNTPERKCGLLHYTRILMIIYFVMLFEAVFLTVNWILVLLDSQVKSEFGLILSECLALSNLIWCIWGICTIYSSDKPRMLWHGIAYIWCLCLILLNVVLSFFEWNMTSYSYLIFSGKYYLIIVFYAILWFTETLCLLFNYFTQRLNYHNLIESTNTLLSGHDIV